jgi:hypothetical protein
MFSSAGAGCVCRSAGSALRLGWSPGLRSVHAPLQQHAIVLGIVQIKFFSWGKFP